MPMPKGAEELLIALQTPSPKGHWGIPALLWGAPGEGKSSFVESLKGPDFPVVTPIACGSGTSSSAGRMRLRDSAPPRL